MKTILKPIHFFST